jgi:hypothetical protein
LKNILPLTFIALTSYLFSQNGFLKNRELFLGSNSIEGKRIIAGIYIVSTDSLTVKMDLTILDDWSEKDSITEYLTLDKSSIKQQLFFIPYHSDSIPAYRYVNENGFEMYLAKETCFESYNQYGEKNKISCQLSLAQVHLPEQKKFYVSSLPVMYRK